MKFKPENLLPVTCRSCESRCMTGQAARLGPDETSLCKPCWKRLFYRVPLWRRVYLPRDVVEAWEDSARAGVEMFIVPYPQGVECLWSDAVNVSISWKVAKLHHKIAWKLSDFRPRRSTEQPDTIPF